MRISTDEPEIENFLSVRSLKAPKPITQILPLTEKDEEIQTMMQ